MLATLPLLVILILPNTYHLLIFISIPAPVISQVSFLSNGYFRKDPNPKNISLSHFLMLHLFPLPETWERRLASL